MSSLITLHTAAILSLQKTVDRFHIMRGYIKTDILLSAR